MRNTNEGQKPRILNSNAQTETGNMLSGSVTNYFAINVNQPQRRLCLLVVEPSTTSSPTRRLLDDTAWAVLAPFEPLSGTRPAVFLTPMIAPAMPRIQSNTFETSTTALSQPSSLFDAFPHHTSDRIMSKKPFLPALDSFPQSIWMVGSSSQVRESGWRDDHQVHHFWLNFSLSASSMSFHGLRFFIHTPISGGRRLVAGGKDGPVSGKPAPR